MARAIEHVLVHYEFQEMEMDTVYRWCPESVVGLRHVRLAGIRGQKESDDLFSVDLPEKGAQR